MDYEFASKDLSDLYLSGKGSERYPPEVVDAYLRRIRHIEAAHTEQDLRNPPSVHFEKLKRKEYTGKFSMRLNQRWRLIISIDLKQKLKTVTIHEITKHYGD